MTRWLERHGLRLTARAHALGEVMLGLAVVGLVWFAFVVDAVINTSIGGV